MLQSSILVFLFCLLASILVQAADTYLHITAEAVNIIQIRTEDAQSNHLSRGLAPWCLDRSDIGSIGNKNFWSCGLIVDQEESGLSMANQSAQEAIISDLSTQYSVLPYTDSDGIHYSVVAPAKMGSGLDWKASSFGVSTQCSPIPASACDIEEWLPGDSGLAGVWPFKCSKDRGGIDFEGNHTPYSYDYTWLDHHKYIQEGLPFRGMAMRGAYDDLDLMANTTDDEVDEIFRNPWQWVGVPKYQGSVDTSSDLYQKDPYIQRAANLDDLVMLHCNSSVYNVDYTVVGGQVTSISKQKSNGTVAGIASMSSMSTANYNMAAISRGTSIANLLQKTPEEFIDIWIAQFTSVLALPIAAQTSPRPSQLVQRRVSKVVTRLPVAALWVLITANVSFALLGLVLAIAALMATTPNVHQVQARLGVAGLTAALFEKTHSERIVRSDTDLFAENVGEKSTTLVKKVGVKRTDSGGTAFTVSEVQVRPQER